jgi:hypothetical protein
MQDLEKLARELQRGGQAQELRQLAASADGQRLGGMVDRTALAEALKTGDVAALKELMAGLLSTAEGRRMSAEVQKLLRERGHG